jgi:ATP-dependent exoDNAse (exonuclease V) alpha subunit
MERGKKLGISINCSTYHYQFGIGCRSKDIPDASHFVIEEASMCPAEHLVIIDQRLRERFDSNKSFGGRSVILVGDFGQLPAVKPLTSLYDNWTGEKHELYAEFTEHRLEKNWRQNTDPEFFELCQSLRKPLSEPEAIAVMNKLNERVVGSQATGVSGSTRRIRDLYKGEDDMYIAGINEQVNKINKPYIKLKRGRKVICNAKYYDQEKNMIAKGEIGKVVRNKKGEFWVRFSGRVAKFKGIGKSNKSVESRFSPAYAITVHKSQGSTYKGNVVIDPSRLFEKNHLYVALTRGTRLDKIYLTEPITFNVLCKTVYISGTHK